MMVTDRFEACIICGAIGDAWGSSYENEVKKKSEDTFYWQAPPEKIRRWVITDDTQLTLASCEAMMDERGLAPETLASWFVRFYQQKKISGAGASTMKAITELAAGGHWSQVGRQGEYAAGNGAAMRMAPFAFNKTINREQIRDFCRITHRNDEAYVGALAVFLSIRAVLKNKWAGGNNLLELLIAQLPDTAVRDRLIAIHVLGSTATIEIVSAFGVDGYVVNSVPFAIFAASQVCEIGIEKMFQEIIAAGGDTDTNASIAGQIAGALVRLDGVPEILLKQIRSVKEHGWIKDVIDRTKNIMPFFLIE